MHAGTLKAFTRLHRASGFNGDDAFVHTDDGLFVDLLNLEQLKDASGALPAGWGMGARVSLRGRVVHRASPVDLHLWVEALQVTAPAPPSSLRSLVAGDSGSLSSPGQRPTGRSLLTPSKRGLRVAHYTAAIDPSCTLKYPAPRPNGSSYEVRMRRRSRWHLLPKCTAAKVHMPRGAAVRCCRWAGAACWGESCHRPAAIPTCSLAITEGRLFHPLPPTSSPCYPPLCTCPDYQV